MKICLINPPYNNGDWDTYLLIMQHIGIGYIASVLEADGYAVDVIECPGEGKNIRDVIKQIEIQQYDMIGISVYFTNKVYAFKLINSIKALFPNTFLYLGGYYPSLYLEEAHKTFDMVDCFVISEGEYTCLDLVKTLEANGDWKQVKGISYLENDKIVMNEPREAVADIDVIPFPKRVVIKDMSVLPIISSRGCYGRCKFCGVREFYNLENITKIRMRSAENFISEIESVIEEFKPKGFFVSDETFFVGSVERKKWLDTFFELLREKNINIEFRCQCRANDVLNNFEYIEKAVEHGMTHLFIGIESFVQRQLDYYQKDNIVETNIKAIEMAKQLNVNLQAGLMLLDPYITIPEIKENIRVIRSLDLINCLYLDETPPFSRSALMAIEGTVLYNELKNDNLLARNDNNYNFYDEKTQKYYSYIDRWNKYTQVTVNNMHIISYLKEVNIDDGKKSESLKKEIMATDLDFIDVLSDMIMQNKPNEELESLFADLSVVLIEKNEQMKSLFHKHGFKTKG